MKQLLILSGKGGTGKTTIASALVMLSECRAFADCDEDAPNLHLVLTQNSIPIKKHYYGLEKAVIDQSKCLNCGFCEQNCRFGAIKNASVDVFECEGCGVCVELCTVHAIKLTQYVSGHLTLHKSEKNVFSTAQLKMGSGASGKLVTAVKQQLLQEAPDESLVVIDGSPGIGCPVIASISGVDMVLIVTEPTISGMHDMKRIIETTKHFGVNCAVCINKFDVNMENAKDIEKYCSDYDIPVIGKIPFDDTVVKAVNQSQSIACYPDSPAGKAVASIWNELKAYVR
jgi:MinD superfamily P-loop ATPase